MKTLENLDRWIGRQIERWSAQLAGGEHVKESVEIRRDILDEIRHKIDAHGFAYAEIQISAAEPIEGLDDDIREMMAQAGIQPPLIELVEDPAAQPFHIEYRRTKTPTPITARPAAKLVVVKGKSEEAEYPIAKDIVYVGRLREVVGKEGGLRRRNDIAFDDSESTVSREHAHIGYVEGRFRLFHDSGERGTRLFREGRSVAVPPSGGRGAQLKSGDEIHLGEARLRFDLS